MSQPEAAPCTACGAPAEIQFSEVDGARVEKTWLCASCAIGRGLLAWEPAAPEEAAPAAPAAPAEDPGRCPGCGTGLEAIRRSGRVGCARCYATFEQQLLPLVERVHGTLVHHGMEAVAVGEKARRREEIAQLQRDLQDAVEREDFEGAARLRDAIRRHRGGGDPGRGAGGTA